jgi:hypothetical protein
MRSTAPKDRAQGRYQDVNALDQPQEKQTQGGIKVLDLVLCLGVPAIELSSFGCIALSPLL